MSLTSPFKERFNLIASRALAIVAASRKLEERKAGGKEREMTPRTEESNRKSRGVI